MISTFVSINLAPSASVLAIITNSFPIMSAYKRAAINFCTCVYVAVTTLPAIWPHFLRSGL